MLNRLQLLVARRLLQMLLTTLSSAEALIHTATYLFDKFVFAAYDERLNQIVLSRLHML